MKNLIIYLFLFSFTTALSANEPVFVNNYEEAVKSKNAVVIFGADWCGSCIKLKNEIKEINFDDYAVCVLDAEKEKNFSNQYKIRSYPTSIILKNGKEHSRKTGYKKSDYEIWLNQNRLK
jgi:thioredoxin-like negative regulator of GroEL